MVTLLNNILIHLQIARLYQTTLDFALGNPWSLGPFKMRGFEHVWNIFHVIWKISSLFWFD